MMKISKNRIPITVTRKDGKAFVIMLEDDYKALEKSASPKNSTNIIQSLRALMKNVHITPEEMIEWKNEGRR